LLHSCGLDSCSRVTWVTPWKCSLRPHWYTPILCVSQFIGDGCPAVKNVTMAAKIKSIDILLLLVCWLRMEDDRTSTIHYLLSSAWQPSCTRWQSEQNDDHESLHCSSPFKRVRSSLQTAAWK